MISHYLLESGRVNRVLIFDCDVHQGDGTARILHNTPEAVTVSLHCEKNFPARKAESDWDIPLPKGMGDADYLKVVDDALNYSTNRIWFCMTPASMCIRTTPWVI